MLVAQDADDAAAIERCRAGETAAFEAIVRRYEVVLYSVAARMLGNRDEAADAAQNTFVKAFERLASYDSRYRFFSWIYRILQNECLNMLRARRSEEPVTAELPVMVVPVDTLEQRQRRAAVQAALLTLPPEYREVVVLRHYADLSYDDIADALGIPAKTVKSRLYTARQRLGERLLGWRPAPR